MQTFKILIILFFVVAFSTTRVGNAAPTNSGYNYQLYKNFENFGILIFPKDRIFTGLGDYLKEIGFNPVESGQAVMRFGLKNENQTMMMPESVQNKHSMDRFITLQVIANDNMVVGIFDPEWGLTLPGPIFNLNGIKENISKTLNLFRKHLKKRETKRHQPDKPERARLLTKNAVTIIDETSHFISKLH
jgi:hypothetical protein